MGVLNERYMRLAIKKARENFRKMDGGPFGACIVKNGKVLAVARNTVLKNDATSHAEMNAIRAASRKTGSFDLSGCVIYSTNEPCPMCFGAIHWARIGLIVYGTRTQDAAKLGFNELCISDRRLRTLGKSKTKLVAGYLHKECKKLLEDWAKLPARKTY